MTSCQKTKIDLLENTTRAYLYRWTHIPSGKWYVGSRTARGCHPSDGYFCSSKEVKPMILANVQEWKREILIIGTPLYIRELEALYLEKLDAKNNLMSFNRHNGDGKFTTSGRIEPEESKQKRIAKLIGRKKPQGFGDIIRAHRIGLKFNDEWKKNIGIASTGRVQSLEAREKNRISNTGDRNGMFGKKHIEESKIKCGLNNKGSKNSHWKGYWVSPIGEKFETIKDALKIYPICSSTNLRIWCKQNKHGWSFMPMGIENE